MQVVGNRYTLYVHRDEIKDTIMDLYGDEWEIVGLEEYI